MRSPLADRMRPEQMEDVVGQAHLFGKGCALRGIVESGEIPNMVFYGPSGVGKTTVARIIAKRQSRRLHRLNGTTASTADIKAIIGEVDTLAAPNGIMIYLDEIQYFNKKQQQSLLEYIENGMITLIASTTENPYFYVYSAILSRSTVFEFKPIEKEDVKKALRRAVDFLSKERGKEVLAADEVLDYIAASSGGDVRKALNAIELCVLAADPKEETVRISMEHAKQLSQKSAMRYDREGDEHYDILSAYQKSMRGSDPDAAVHYLARLLEAGDLPSACRRLMVCACEDVGLAYPAIIPTVKACVDAALQVGLPEAAIPLSDAVILVALAPKSNSGANAIWAAMEDVRTGKTGSVPDHLKDSNYGGAKKMGRGLTYRYAHDFEDGWVEQQYLPDKIKDAVYYHSGNNKNEQAFKNYWDQVKKKKGR